MSLRTRMLFTEDAMWILPNRDPIRGRDAIIEFSRQVRDVFGPFDGPRFDHLRASGAGGRTAHIVAAFTVHSGALQMIYDGFYERQPDGRVLLAVEHDGFRDALGEAPPADPDRHRHAAMIDLDGTMRT